MQLDELVVDNKRRSIQSNRTDDDDVVSGFEFVPSESNKLSGQAVAKPLRRHLAGAEASPAEP